MTDEAANRPGDLMKILNHRTATTVRFARALINGKDDFDAATWNATLEARAFLAADKEINEQE